MHAINANYKNLALSLINKGADVNAQGNRGETALYIAANNGFTSLANTLLAKGADPNAALMPASWWGKTKAIEFLLEHGANVNHKGGMNETQWTPLMHAAYSGHAEAVNLLLDKGADVYVTADGQETALSLALKKGQFDIADALIEHGADLDVALMPASWLGDLDAALFLIEHGADLNYKGGLEVKWTPLMHAAWHGHKSLVIFLLDEGANVNARGINGETALGLAASRGHTDIARILKAAGGV